MQRQSHHNSSLGNFSGSVISERLNESSSYKSSSDPSNSSNGRKLKPSTKPSLLKSNTNLPALLESIKQETMLLWTRNNPIHDLECAQAAVKRIANGTLYVMEADGAHWPQYEAPEEFNRVARDFFAGA